MFNLYDVLHVYHVAHDDSAAGTKYEIIRNTWNVRRVRTIRVVARRRNRGRNKILASADRPSSPYSHVSCPNITSGRTIDGPCTTYTKKRNLTTIITIIIMLYFMNSVLYIIVGPHTSALVPRRATMTRTKYFSKISLLPWESIRACGHLRRYTRLWPMNRNATIL